jgi:hypothetical protein
MTAMSMTPPARAVAHVRRRAEAAREDARSRIAQLLERAHQPSNAADALAYRVRHAEVTLNFHPDRRRSDGLTVAEGMLQDGEYKSQFETGLSNGSRTAFPGGDRDRWEAQLFGGAYHEALASTRARPKYGALNVMRHPDGGSPRFGSCHVILAHHVGPRCTFTWGDSHVGPVDVGTIDVLEPLIAALLRDVIEQGRALGVNGLTLLDVLHSAPGTGPGSRPRAAIRRRRGRADRFDAQDRGFAAMRARWLAALWFFGPVDGKRITSERPGAR